MLLSSVTYAQFKTSSNKINKKIIVRDSVQFEKRRIVPNTFFVKNVDTSFYYFNYHTNTLVWLKSIKFDSVEIGYRFFNFNFNTNAKRFNYDSIKDNFIAKPINIKHQTDVGGIFGANNDMHYNGSFGRSLSFGNNQSAVFNSQLNLQINGMLGDSIEVAAAITDNNIPIQPDGTTQQLNEFDRILLQFKKRNWQIDLGDIDLRTNQNYFLNFYKRLQGISYQKKKFE